jgi:type VI secretion system secreted protein VgrG
MVTSLNPTQNVLLTAGQNRVVMEDLDAKQYFRASSPTQRTFLHLGAPRVGPPEFPEPEGATEHNLVLSTDGNGLIHTGTDVKETVGGNRTTHVTKKSDETVDEHVTQTFNKGLTQKVTAEGEVREVTGKVQETIHGEREQTIEGKSTEKITGQLEQTVTQGIKITTPNTCEVKADGGYKLEATAGIKLETPAKLEITAHAGIETNAPTEHMERTSYKLSMAAAEMGIYGSLGEIVAGLKVEAQNNVVSMANMKVDLIQGLYANQPIAIHTVGQVIQQGYVNLHTFGLVSIL